MYQRSTLLEKYGNGMGDSYMHQNYKKSCGMGITSQWNDACLIKMKLLTRKQPPEYDIDHSSKIILVYNGQHQLTNQLVSSGGLLSLQHLEKGYL